MSAGIVEASSAPRPPSFFELNGQHVAAGVSVGQRSWNVRAQNCCAVVSWLAEGETLQQETTEDEHAILVFDDSAVEVDAGPAGRVIAEAPALVIVPAGRATVLARRAGFVMRVFTSRAKVVASAVNDADYRTADPAVAALPPKPVEPGPGSLRVHPMSDVAEEPGRLGRIFRTDSLMINWFAPQPGPRDTARLTPHVHDDFEQVSVTVAGEYVHHVRRPWTSRLGEWRPDEHVQCSSPSVTVIPPGNVHTTRAVGEGLHVLVDVFAPPRPDFVERGWVLNQSDYAGAAPVDDRRAAADLLAGYGPREAELPVVDGILHADLLPEVARWELSAALRHYRDPFVGVTTDGVVAEGLYRLAGTGASAKPAVDAARGFLAALEQHQRLVAQLPMDSPDWRLWTNAFPVWTPKGIRLDRVTAVQRDAALALVEASLSPDGFRAVRDAMRLNGALGELVERYRDSLTEFTYYLTVFGDPQPSEPWGWQLMGHHVDVHCVFVGSQLVLAPVFLGAEPTFGIRGPHAGVRVLDLETTRGLALRRALGAGQESAFLLGDSLRSADLPAELGGPFNGRHLAGAGRDNLVLPYEGVRGDDLTLDQQRLLRDLVDVYVGRLPAEHAERKRRQVHDHLDETYFAWRGKAGDTDAFYYRVHSPVLLVEYDNHPGIFLNNEEPERFHVHTIVREPNGNDYGKSLLAQHYARYHS
ncbi:DUF3500 domain-containing protein [Dactylosporangium sp. CA-092794]|uniref:DUF3500 domain-containing protein n=1 Tax=Dactylosporangium sp. CA-092794 TaxID=3239929 RepID=UPI003D8B67B0